MFLTQRAASYQASSSQPPFFLALALVFAILGGCRSSQKHYVLRGRVLAKSSHQLTVSQQDIPGFMAAMTMPYPVKDPEGLGVVQPGDAITAELVVQGEKNYWLENIVVIGNSHTSVSTDTGETDIEDENGAPVLGSQIPDVRLINQDEKTIHLSDFKGRAVLVTFIYTRCPFPTFCPLLSSEFASVHRELLKDPELYKKTHLVSISLDPAYDTAPVLRKYGLGYLKNDSAGFAHWDFASTTPGDLKTISGAFGLTYSKQDNLITHTMRTVLVARDGTVVKIWDGSEWRQSELIDAVRRAAAGS
jgi:protein SCO1